MLRNGRRPVGRGRRASGAHRSGSQVPRGRAMTALGISPVWLAVWRRNYLVRKQLAAESVLGNIIEPLFYLVGFGTGFGAMLPEVDGVKDIAYIARGNQCYPSPMSG